MAEKLSKEELVEIQDFCKNVRCDIIKMIYNAKSGHPGGNLSAVEILSVLYKKCLVNFPNWNKNPNFENRDRFILSKGHASAALYSVLANLGYFDKKELLSFRKLNSKLQGHPSCRHMAGIEVSTGSLGQGLSVACGVALGLRLDKKSSKVVAYCGDGELQEGNIWEGVMNAAHFNLGNLTLFVDRNGLQIDGTTENIKSVGDVVGKFKAFGWEAFEIDGHNIEEIYEAYQKAQEINKPVAIIANTIKGKGVSFMENNVAWHGKAPKAEEFEKAMAELEA